MKVLLAGASGAIGIPITRQLLAHGHEVLGLTRDPAGARRLEALGAADAVIHELTALRKPPLRHGGMALTNRLRTQGMANLLTAAEALGPGGPSPSRSSSATAKAELGWRLTFPHLPPGIRAASTEEVSWRSHGRSGAGTRSA
jgi:uncharacterized protein YbjT (DUF2867 family)